MAELPSSIQLVVVTREKKVLETTAQEVVLPGMNGYFGVLPGHTPLLAILKVGVIQYRDASGTSMYVMTGGFAEVLPDRVIVLAEEAYSEEEIDTVEAERMRAEAERELASLASHDEAFAVASAKLEESIAMGQVASKRVH